MREVSVVKQYHPEADLGDFAFRNACCVDPSFVFGHYRIGMSYLSVGFFRKPNPDMGFATVGGVRIGDKLYYAVSLCSPLDNFSKKVGRQNVIYNMLDMSSSRKRGVFDISNMKDDQPALILKQALEHYLNTTKHLPPWTKQTIYFRKQRAIPPVLKAEVRKCSLSQLMGFGSEIQHDERTKRSNAAFKAWETRRKNMQD